MKHKTPLSLHTAICLKISSSTECLFSILDTTKVFSEILMALEGFQIEGVVWHSCTASWDGNDHPSLPGIPGAPIGMKSTAASDARSQAQILHHITDPHLQSRAGCRRKPPRIPVVSFSRKLTLKSAVNYRDLRMVVHGFLFLQRSNSKAQIYEVQ